MKHSDWLETHDNYSIFFQKWEKTSAEHKGVIQIAHGMAEHIDRYQTFAKFLVDKDFIVYGNDHRGHGQTGKEYGMGHFDYMNGFEKATTDLLTLTEKIKIDHPTLPIVLFGHSMGSFLVRNYLLKDASHLSGVILSGTGSEPLALTRIGKLLAKLQMKSKGWDQPSPFLNKIVFGNYARRFKNRETDFNWLSRDQDKVQAYIKDPYTGFVPNTSFFYDLFDGIETIQDSDRIATIPKNLPFLFISGTHDPVGNYTKGVKKTIHQYQRQGIKNIEYNFYQDARHELLHELNRDEVMIDTIQWIEKQLQI